MFKPLADYRARIVLVPWSRIAAPHRPPAGFRRAHGVGAGEEGSGDEEGPAGVLERALASKLL